MKKNLLLIASLLFVISNGFAETPALTLQKTSKTCTPDGVINTDGTEPWTSTWINMTAKKAANQSDEISAKFQLAYNDEYLWLACEQTGNSTMDTDPAFITQSWQRDDFEIFVSLDTTAYANRGAYGEYNNQFRLQRAATYPWAFDDAHSIFRNHSECTIGQLDAGDGSFVQEWQMSWAALISPMVDSGNFDGSYIRFEIQAADNTTGVDGGRTDQIFWRNNSDNEYQDSRTLSVVKLATPVNIKVPGDSVSFISPVKSTIWRIGSVDTIGIYFYKQSGNYDYAVYYQKVGGSKVFLNEIYHSGLSSTVWNISTSMSAGKFNIVLYDYYKSKYYYSDTFMIKPAEPEIDIVAPFNGSHIQSGNNMNIQYYSVFKDTVNVELSIDNGLTWDTLLLNQVIPALSYKTSKIFIPGTSNKKGVLKITNYRNTLSDSIIINLTTEAEYKFLLPSDTSNWKAGTIVNVKFSKSDSLTTYWHLTCYKVGKTSSVLSSSGTQTGLVSLNLGLNQIVDSGKYYMQVYDSYTGQSSFSDTFNIVPADPALSIVSPVTGYYMVSGENFYLKWSSVSIDKIFIVFTKNGGTTWDTLAKNIASPNSYSNSVLIKAPVVTGTYTSCILRIGSLGTTLFSFINNITLSDVSPFQFIAPAKNAIWTADSIYTVQFNNTLSHYSYVYYLKLDSTNTMNSIGNSNQSGLNSLNWHIDQYTDSGNYVIAIYDNSFGRYFYGDTFFIAPAPPKLKILSPTSNYYLFSGETFSINWSAINSGPIDVFWSKDGGATWDTVASNISSPNSSSNYATINVPIVTTTYTGCLFKILNKAHTAFSVVANIIVSNESAYQFIYPTASTIWTAGSSVNIIFNNYLSNYWDLYYQKIGGSSSYIRYGNQTGVVSLTWNINTSLDSGYYQLAIYDETLQRYFYSDTFYIAPAPPSLSLYLPQNGATIYSGYNFEVEWYSVNSGYLNIEISKDQGITWDTIARNIYSPNYGYYYYYITAPVFTEYVTGGILKISNLSNTLSSSVSNLTFSNKPPHEFAYPTKNTTVYPGSILPIKVMNNNNNYTYLDFYYQKISSGSSYFGYIYSTGDSVVINWSVPASIDTGKYRIYLYDENLSQYFYSDTFKIGSPVPPVTLPLISQSEISVNAYPNPFNNKLEISYELTNRSRIEIGMYDLLGKFVKSIYSGTLPAGKQCHILDVSDLQSGAYLLQLKTSEGYSKKQIIIKR